MVAEAGMDGEEEKRSVVDGNGKGKEVGKVEDREYVVLLMGLPRGRRWV